MNVHMNESVDINNNTIHLAAIETIGKLSGNILSDKTMPVTSANLSVMNDGTKNSQQRSHDGLKRRQNVYQTETVSSSTDQSGGESLLTDRSTIVAKSDTLPTSNLHLGQVRPMINESF